MPTRTQVKFRRERSEHHAIAESFNQKIPKPSACQPRSWLGFVTRPLGHFLFALDHFAVSAKYFLWHFWLKTRRFCKSPFMTFMRRLSAGGAVPMVMTDRSLRFNGNVRLRVPIRKVWLEGCSERIRITEQTRASAETSGFGWTARTIGKARLVTRRSQLRTGEKAPRFTELLCR